jgi:uncharacterized protein YndB with AHSA1/START domain
MTDATLLTGGTRPQVRLERDLADAPHLVWRAITDREALRAWFPGDVVVDGGRWEVGAKISFVEEEHNMSFEGEVLEVDEPRLLVFTWGDDTLRFELTATDRGTRLVLVDELPPETAARNAAGWDDCLDLLAGRDPGEWQLRFEAYAEKFAPELGPQAGPPPEYLTS